jgi:hypothetical protein
VYRKDEFTMKKLLALFIIGGLLTTITGCPPSSTTPTTKKGTSGTTEATHKAGKTETKIKEEKGPGGEMKTEDKKRDDKKSDSEPKPGDKKEQTKTEEKKK